MVRTARLDEPVRATACAGMALALAGCGTWLNEEHCLFEGGDRGCAAGQSCVVVIGGGEVPEANDGCIDEARVEELDPGRHLHLRYGLPMFLEAENDVLQSDSVQGILAREIDARGLADVCSDIEGMTSFASWPELEVVFAARRRLEGLRSQRKVRDDEAAVSEVEATAVQDLYATIETWALACEEELEGSSSGSETAETTTSTTATASTTDEPACTANEECTDPATQFCDGNVGECVSCDEMPDPDSACAELDPMTPLCAGGVCVACTASNPEVCHEQSLVCDTTTSSCVPCTEHAQCGEAACDLFTGTCFPSDAVVHVGPGLELSTLAEAIVSFPPEAHGTIIIHEGSYYESAVIDLGRRLALLAAAGEVPSLDSAGVQVTVDTSAAVIIEGLRIGDNTGGIGLVLDGQAWLDRVQLVNNGLGAQLQPGAYAVFRNCTVGYLTGSGYNALYVDDDASATILYSTLVGDADLGNGLICSPLAMVTVRNSIIANYDGNPIDCAADISYSAMTNLFAGDGNQEVSAEVTSWFPSFPSGDFHLASNLAYLFEGIAQWQIGDPSIDLDGDPRPILGGAPDFPGADVPIP